MRLRAGGGAAEGQRGGGQIDCRRGHLGLGQRAGARQPLDRVAVGVAGREVHVDVDVDGVALQRLLDHRQRLDELAPIHGPQGAQAADAVAHRDLVGGLVLRLDLHQLLDRQAGFGQPLLDPGQRQRQRRTAALQPARQLGHEGAGQRRVRTRHVGDDQDQALGVLLDHLEHAVGPQIGQLALVGGDGHANRHAPQVLDQRQAQHDRHRPQLAELERLDGLVRGDETGQRAAAQPPVAVGHGLQREIVDAGQARRRPAAQPRQLAAVTRRQMALGGADLFFDEVEVVEQPLAGGRHAALQLGVAHQARPHGHQHLFVHRQPRQQAVTRARRGQFVRSGQALAVLRHLVGGEELGTQRRFVGIRRRARHHAGQAGLPDERADKRP